MTTRSTDRYPAGPSYSRLSDAAFLGRIRVVYEMMHACALCPRECRADRYHREGACHARITPKVASVTIHHGEEPPISGSHGSGTIFFAHCNLGCVYCQNYPISQLGIGTTMSTARLAVKMLWIKRKGAHNVNFVTPSHMVPQLLAALYLARRQGFDLPVVYNTSGYDSPAALDLLDGIVDIFLADIRYADNDKARRYSGVADYVEHDFAAIKRMLAMVGPLVTDAQGAAVRGLVIRLLVFPGFADDTIAILRRIHDEISPDVPISLMSQYFPAHRAHEFPEIARRLMKSEYDAVVREMERLGFEGWIQRLDE